MKHDELIQKMLANSIEKLIGSAAEVVEYCTLLLIQKRDILAKKQLGNVYEVKSLINEIDTWQARSLDKQASMKVVGVNEYVDDYNLVRRIKWNYDELKSMALKIYFVQNPNDIIKSKKPVTEAEKRILKEILPFYNGYCSDYERLKDINRELMSLKHNYSVSYEVSWSWSIEDLLDPSFLKRGLMCGNIRLL